MNQPDDRSSLLVANPLIGIFWCVVGPDQKRQILSKACTLAEAEPYADCLTYGTGHIDIWQAWRRKPPLSALATLLRDDEYEDWPRGRIVFDTKEGCFFLYADRKLQADSTIAAVVAIFGLQDSKVIVRSDAHYRSNRSLAVPRPA